ncbi:hypothetical protein BKCO1_8000131 [Neofusicoccum parvum]|uniref:YggU-like protein n=2 Tax=Neofusicoccum TaxID=407951 RepID=A0ABR3SXN7_9PEZI|nr:hypothetical protein BKCO1_8000131 [Neofusicoccum parvum]GME40966.1 hypothetical protein BKCO1_8000131 [Neofusicoccum parvum]
MSNAIRFIASKGNKATSAGSVSLACHVKPGASAKREGIISVLDEGVELCVSAQAKEGEANKAVQKLFAEVLNVPKSDVEIAKGMKSREKTVMIHNLAKGRSPEEHIESIRNALIESVEH